MAPGTLREHAILTLPGIQLVSTLLIRYLFERRYLDGERVLPHWPAAKALRILAYVLSALAFVISRTVFLFTLKYL